MLWFIKNHCLLRKTLKENKMIKKKSAPRKMATTVDGLHKKGRLYSCELCREAVVSLSGMRIPIADGDKIFHVASVHVCQDCYDKFLQLAKQIMNEAIQKQARQQEEIEALSEDGRKLKNAINILENQPISAKRRELLKNYIQELADAIEN